MRFPRSDIDFVLGQLLEWNSYVPSSDDEESELPEVVNGSQ